jgi:hypothetical protein
MVFTQAQTTAFFEAADQMGIPHDTREQLEFEGIESVSDLSDFDKDTLTQVADNLRRPGGRIPNPDPNAPAGATIAQPPFVFGAKAQKRLLAACDMVRYYEMIDRELSAPNMRWEPVIKNFTQQWKALKDRKDDEAPEVPKISKTLSIIKWTEAFTDFLHRKIGVRMVPLAYVVRELIAVPAPPPLVNDLPYSTLHGSVEGEMIARASHAHPLFRDDNSAVYYLLEEATRGTSYAPTIKPYQRTKQGREAWRSLVNQYAGQDKWEAEVKRQDDLLHNRQWKGQSNFSLEKFIAQHRNAYVSMRQCVEHITFQLPNERTRVAYLLDAIQCNDPGLQAAMANVRTDTDPADGKMNDFEATASYLLPYDPVSKKRAAGNKRGLASISEVSGADDTTDVSSVTFGGNGGKAKASIGKTGVEFRYYKPPEYNQLGADQKAELKEHRDGKKSSPAPNKSKKPRNNTRDDSKHKKWIASAVEKQLAQKGQEVQDDDTAESEFKSYIMSLISNSQPNHPPVQATTAAASAKSKPTITLNSILRKAKRG